MKKGISPIIATILLIAVAISVGIMVTTWITHWVVEQTTSTSISCAVDTNYIVDSVEFNKTTLLNNTLLIKVTNKGSEKIYGFGAILDNGTYIKVFNYTNSNVDQGGLSSVNKLEREQSAYIKINLTNTLSDIKITNAACPAVSTSTTTITKYP
jgi:flagellin-like protein